MPRRLRRRRSRLSMPFLHTSLSLTLAVLYPRCGPRLRRRLSALLRPGTTLRFVPDRRTSLLLVLPAVVLYAHVFLCLTCRRLPALVWGRGMKVKIKSASGGPAQRAAGERCPAAVPGGWLRPVGCSLRPAPEATRVPPGAQPAAASVDAGFYFRRLPSRRNPGRATPARRREHPTSGGYCALRFARLRRSLVRVVGERVMLRAQ